MTANTHAMNTGPAIDLSTTPARRALVAYARQRRLRLDQLADVLRLNDLDMPAVLNRRRMSWHIADRIAVALGRHPYELWPEWFDRADADPGIDSEEGAFG